MSSMPEEFVYNAWYVAAWGEEITRTPMRRVLLDEPGSDSITVVRVRRSRDKGRCRRARACAATRLLRADRLSGFGQRRCRASVVDSRPSLRARSALAFSQRYADAARAYALVLDNLMDLSHETFIHADTIGSPDVAETPIRTKVDGTMVRCFRHMENAPVPPFYAQSTGITSSIDRWQDIEYDVPAFYTLHVRVAEAGAPDERAFFSKVMYALTPETKNSTHDFWVISRKSGAPPAWIDRVAVAFQNSVLSEDLEALEALEVNLPAGGWQELSISNDRGGLQWRRVFRERAVLDAIRPLSSV